MSMAFVSHIVDVKTELWRTLFTALEQFVSYSSFDVLSCS